MTSPIAEYFEALDDLTGGPEPKNILITEERERPPLWVLIYRDLLEASSITAFTYGLSDGDHPHWVKGKPELVISVHSHDERWALAIGFVAKKLRGKCAFAYGEIVRFGDRITPETEMSAFLIFAPSVLDERQRHIVLSDRTINVAQMYPIYEDEIDLIESSGVEALFGNEEYDPYSVKRPSVFRWPQK